MPPELGWETPGATRAIARWGATQKASEMIMALLPSDETLTAIFQHVSHAMTCAAAFVVGAIAYHKPSPLLSIESIRSKNDSVSWRAVNSPEIIFFCNSEIVCSFMVNRR